MKSFKSYISEEVLPTARVENGNFDLENEAVRSEVNSILAGICSVSCVTPYVALRKVSKALAYFSVILPKRTFLEGDKGVEVYEIRQFGDRIGMTDQGEFVTEVPVKYHLFFQYVQVMGRFMVTAKVVDQAELDRLLDTAEMTMKESCDDKATMSQRKAGREEIQTNGNHGSPSTDKAMDTSGEKSANVEKKWPAVVKEAMTRKHKDMAVRRFMSHDPKAGESILAMGKKDREEKKSFASGKKEVNRLKEEEQIDEASYDKLDNYVRNAHVSGTGAAARGEIAMHRGQKTRLHRANKTGEKREQGINLALDKMAGRALVPAKRKEKMEEGRMPPSVIAHKQKLASMSDKDFAEKHGHKSEKQLRDMGARHGYGFDKATKTGSDHYVKRVSSSKQMEEAYGVYRKGGSIGEKPSKEPHKTFDSAEEAKSHAKGMNKQLSPGEKKYYGIKYHVKSIKEEDNLDEGMAPIKKSYGMRKLKKKVSTAVKQGLGVEKVKDKTILVTNKGDPKAAGGGGVHRIPRDKYDPSKHNMASE